MVSSISVTCSLSSSSTLSSSVFSIAIAGSLITSLLLSSLEKNLPIKPNIPPDSVSSSLTVSVVETSSWVEIFSVSVSSNESKVLTGRSSSLTCGSVGFVSNGWYGVSISTLYATGCSCSFSSVSSALSVSVYATEGSLAEGCGRAQRLDKEFGGVVTLVSSCNVISAVTDLISISLVFVSKG